MADQSARLEKVRRYWEYAGADVDRADEIYHDDAVLEFPRRAPWRAETPADPE